MVPAANSVGSLLAGPTEAGGSLAARAALQIDGQLPAALQAQLRHNVAHGPPLRGRLVASQGNYIGQESALVPFAVIP